MRSKFMCAVLLASLASGCDVSSGDGAFFVDDQVDVYHPTEADIIRIQQELTKVFETTDGTQSQTKKYKAFLAWQNKKIALREKIVEATTAKEKNELEYELEDFDDAFTSAYAQFIADVFILQDVVLPLYFVDQNAGVYDTDVLAAIKAHAPKEYSEWEDKRVSLTKAINAEEDKVKKKILEDKRYLLDDIFQVRFAKFVIEFSQ